MDPQRGKIWEQRIPMVKGAGSCRFCKKELEDGYDSFWGNCKHFGIHHKGSPESKKAYYYKVSDEGSGSKNERYLQIYRNDILPSLIDKYPVKREEGVRQVMLFTHRHTKVEINERRENVGLPDISEERVYTGIPIYPVQYDVGAAPELLVHCLEVLLLIGQKFGQEPLDIHVQMGSSNTGVGAAAHALYTYIRHHNPRWTVYDYYVDLLYGDEFIGINEGSKLHMMTQNFKFFSDYVEENRRTSQKSAEQKKEITRLESELSKTTALLGGLKKEITHLKTELAGLDSELLKVTSLLSDYGSALSAESVRINSLLDKKSEEE